jgi:hypothetical protein
MFRRAPLVKVPSISHITFAFPLVEVTFPVHYRYEKLIRIAGVNVVDSRLFETTLIIY